MKYLIYSDYWSENDGDDRYWGPDKSGYYGLVAKAGIYTQGDKDRMENESFLMRNHFVPFTDELIEKGFNQLEKVHENIKKEFDREADRHKCTIARIKNEDKYRIETLNKFKEISSKIFLED